MGEPAKKQGCFSPEDGHLPWTHWNPHLGDWRANFYALAEPYECKTMAVCVTGARDWKRRTDEMKARVDAEMAEKGYVTFDKLPPAVQELWANEYLDYPPHSSMGRTEPCRGSEAGSSPAWGASV